MNSQPLDANIPRDLQAERAVLGSILLEPDRLDAVACILSDDDFYLDDHRHAFRALETLRTEHVAIDTVTLKDCLERNGGVGKAGGTAYIAALADGIPNVSHVEHYSRIVREKAALRGLIRICETVARDAVRQELPANALIEQASVAFRELAGPDPSSRSSSDVTGDSIPAGWLRPAEVLRSVPAPTERFESTAPALNTASRGGLPSRALVVYQGPPDSGKTGLGIQDVLSIAMSHDVVAVLYTPDQGREATAVRVGALLGLNARKLEERDEAALARFDEALGARRIFLPDDSDEGNTLEQVISDAEKIRPDLPHVLLADSLQECRASAKIETTSEKDRVIANVRVSQRAVKSQTVSWLVIATSQTTKASEGRDPRSRPPTVLAGADSAKIGFAPQLIVHLEGDPAQAPRFGRGLIAKNKLGGPKPTFGLRLDQMSTRLEEIDAAAAAESRDEAQKERRLKESEKAQRVILRAIECTKPPQGYPGLSESKLARIAKLRKTGQPFLDGLDALTAGQGVLEAVDGPRGGTYYRRRQAP